MEIITYNFNSFFIAIESDIDLVSDILGQIYPAAVVSKKGAGYGEKTDIQFRVVKSSGHEKKYTIYDCQREMFSSKQKDSVLSELEWLFTNAVLSHLSFFLQLHAGGVVVNNRAMLIVADHGTGKTTLVSSLLLKGYKCLSDDIILVDPDSGHFHSFLRAFKISSRLTGYIAERQNKTFMKVTDKKKFCRINPEKISKDLFSNASKAGWIIFLKKNRSAECKLRPIGQCEAFTSLLQNSFNMEDHGYKGIETIANMVESSRCYEMNRGNVEEATELLSNMLINDTHKSQA